MKKFLHGRNSRRDEIGNRPKLLDLVNYQHSQNLQNLSTRVDNKTLAQQGLGTKPGVGHGLPVFNKVKKKSV